MFSQTAFTLTGLVTNHVPLVVAMVFLARSYEPEGRYTQTSFTYRQKKITHETIRYDDRPDHNHTTPHTQVFLTRNISERKPIPDKHPRLPFSARHRSLPDLSCGPSGRSTPRWTAEVHWLCTGSVCHDHLSEDTETLPSLRRQPGVQDV